MAGAQDQATQMGKSGASPNSVSSVSIFGNISA
jgi:hypothetical protein